MIDLDERPGPVAITARSLASLFGFGAVVLPTFDGFHTYSNTIRYTSPVALRAAWWVPLNFGLGLVFGGTLYAFLYHWLGGKRAPPPWRHLLLGLGLFGGLYAWSGFYHGANETKLIILAAAAVALFAWLDRSLAGALCLLVTAVTGPVLEVALVRAGVFEHLQPDFLGVPMWLPALYACAAPVIGQGARRLLEAKTDPRPAGASIPT